MKTKTTKTTKTNKKDDKKTVVKADKKTDKKTSGKKEIHPLIKSIRITEKSSLLADKGKYTFNVQKSANKREIKKAIKLVYKVDPVKVTITQITSKKVVRRGKIGTKSSGKKAVVYLKKGDKIEFV